MVEQLGLAIILSSAVSTSALTSGTTSFLVGSIRHADELSTTVVPAAAKSGAWANDVLHPAENKARSGFCFIASPTEITLYCLPLKVSSLPTLFSDATNNNSVTGKLRSARTCNILVPTNPVAPTTATFIFVIVNILFLNARHKYRVFLEKAYALGS